MDRFDVLIGLVLCVTGISLLLLALLWRGGEVARTRIASTQFRRYYTLGVALLLLEIAVVWLLVKGWAIAPLLCIAVVIFPIGWAAFCWIRRHPSVAHDYLGGGLYQMTGGGVLHWLATVDTGSDTYWEFRPALRRAKKRDTSSPPT